MTQSGTIERRQHPRHALQAMYTSVEATRPSAVAAPCMLGHAYDVSEGGVRIELDDALPLGEAVDVRLNLPGETRSVAAQGHVVWVNPEDDDPGPRRMALRFTDFVTSGDRDRLRRFLDSGRPCTAAA